MSITICAGTPSGPSVQAGVLLAAANAFGGVVGGIINFAAQVIQGAAGQVPADSILLINTNILEHHREHEFDGPTYLWTRHTIRLTAVYNPLLNSYNQNNPFALPSARAGFKGPVTDVALRHYLAQPRRNLQLYIGGQLYFQSPRAGTTVDAQNGPFPRVNNIRLISGTKTFLVDLTFETCLNESYLFTNKPTVMLSHTYSSEHDVDADFFCTRTIHGHAFFDTSRLVQLGARADDFRAYLFHGISPGFHRVSIQALVDEGGGELLYTIVDRELCHSLGEFAAARGVTRIECTHGSSIDKPDIFEQVIGSGMLVADAAMNSGGKAKGFWKRMPGVKQFVDLLKGAAEGAWAARKNIPVNKQDIVCRVWGNNNASRGGLRSVVQRVLDFRMANLPFNIGATHMSWLDDIGGAFVQGTLSVTQSPVPTLSKTAILGLVPALLNGSLRPLYPPPPGGAPGSVDELPQSIPGVLSTTPVSLIRPPASGTLASLTVDAGARGSYIESLVSSALLAPNTAPPQPGNTPYAKSRTPPDGTVTNPTFP